MDEETANLLSNYPNQSQVAREAIKLYLGDILPGTVQGLRTSFEMLQASNQALLKQLKDMDSKLDYMDKKL